MSASNELFPFPGQKDEDTKGSPTSNSDLPAFPEGEPDSSESLSPTEVKELRSIIKLFRNSNAQDLINEVAVKPSQPEKAAPPEELPVFPAEPSAPTVKPNVFRESMLQFLDSAAITEVWEVETRTALKSILQEISNDAGFVKVWGSIVGAFPAKKCLRHGTPEQKLFALIAFGDRFLQSVSGEVFPGRKKLLKTIGSYLSAVSENYNFIQMENETFSSQYHERVQGSSSSGRLIKEMHGFLVVGKDNNQVVRTGLVLT